MQRLATAFTFALAAAGLYMAICLFFEQRRSNEHFMRVEQTLAEQREAYNSRDENRRQDNRWFNLLLRVQESPWIGDKNAPVQCRLAVEADVVRVGEPIRVLVEVRNVSDRKHTIGGISLEPFTLTLTHNDQEAKYVGPWKSMSPPMPVTLPPWRVMRQSLVLSSAQFAELKLPGSFAISWAYTSDAHDPKITWEGTLPPARVEWQAR